MYDFVDMCLTATEAHWRSETHFEAHLTPMSIMTYMICASVPHYYLYTK